MKKATKNRKLSLEKIDLDKLYSLDEASELVKEITTTKGIVIMLNKLIIAVRDIDKATSPFAKDVSIFDVTPPGAADIIITPIASSGEIDQIFTNMNATIGSKII